MNKSFKRKTTVVTASMRNGRVPMTLTVAGAKEWNRYSASNKSEGDVIWTIPEDDSIVQGFTTPTVETDGWWLIADDTHPGNHLDKAYWVYEA